MTPLTSEPVLDAADRLVAAFASNDAAAYFASFSADASFVFHIEPKRLDDRSQYEALWADWSRSGWRVESCQSSERLVQVAGDTAVFSHTVSTTTSIEGVTTETTERETIVFVREPSGELLAIHEHLSPLDDESHQEGSS